MCRRGGFLLKYTQKRFEYPHRYMQKYFTHAHTYMIYIYDSFNVEIICLLSLKVVRSWYFIGNNTFDMVIDFHVHVPPKHKIFSRKNTRWLINRYFGGGY